MSNTPLRNIINLLTDKNIVSIDTASVGYNYYGFMSKSGVWTIMREKQDQTEYRYAVGNMDYDTNWLGRTGLIYQYPSDFRNA